MSTDTTAPPSFGWPWPLNWPMPQISFGPDRLTQPINPGWTFGNLIVNQQNSSAPEVEQSVVSRHSYGRQIGRLMEAVAALGEALPKTANDPRIQDFRALAAEVAQIKQASATQRLDRLRAELQALKAQDPQAWKDLTTALR
ncbi:hypothetical protein [Aquabacterium sp.]|uniref:hypothetical protein n=1 Tax=Aquabacterium sp. TaxID=1872578 RepID=UPI003783EFE2